MSEMVNGHVDIVETAEGLEIVVTARTRTQMVLMLRMAADALSPPVVHLPAVRPRGALPGQRNANAAHSDEEVRAMVLAIRGGETTRAVAARYGVSAPWLSRVMNGHIWRRVTEQLDAEPQP